MAMKYLVDFAYRNICFFNFLENSLKNWNLILSQRSKEKITIQQKLFREINDDNLVNNQQDEKNCGKHTEEMTQLKKEKVREWAKRFNQNLSKELNTEEINIFIDKIIYPTVFDKLE